MGQRIVIIQGHPDPAGGHFGHALADAYAHGARAGGHEVRRVEVAALDFPLVRTRADWVEGVPPADIARVQDDIAWSGHVVLCYPLWLGTMPALLKGFLEQVLRQDFAFGGAPGQWNRALKGRSARIVVTMGMPAAVYRWYFGAHSLRSLERNVLGFCGIHPIRESLVGLVEGSARGRRRWLARMERLGHAAR
ncbi:MAG: NAD(P)H-dependent oxidoreductase [Halofilum sp. (in: g-proteobacteria)]|nr:NAD(P)H-dependent oxidoreductase [Halofilum sp. (in: g-proteobacteria)]